jgi:hypothetical protein
MRFVPACLGLLLLAAPALRGDDSGVADLAPAKNWVLPLFTKEGFHSLTLTGDEVHPVSADRIDVVNILIQAFSGGAVARVDYILVSPAASYFPRESRASGPSGVRLIRDDGEITGEDWSYAQKGEKISIRRNVRVVFKEKMTDILR